MYAQCIFRPGVLTDLWALGRADPDNGPGRGLPCLSGSDREGELLEELARRGLYVGVEALVHCER